MSLVAFLSPFVVLEILVVLFRTRLWLAGLAAFSLASGLWSVGAGVQLWWAPEQAT